jgi:hypothetical protein
MEVILHRSLLVLQRIVNFFISSVAEKTTISYMFDFNARVLRVVDSLRHNHVWHCPQCEVYLMYSIFL